MSTEVKQKRVKRQALPDAKRGNLFLVDPLAVEVVTDPEHYLYDARAEEPLSEEFLASLEDGVEVPVFVTKDGLRTMLVAGRGRTIGLRIVNERREKAGLERLLLPTIVKKGSPIELKALMILENEARREDSPLNKARKTQQYLAMLLAKDEDEGTPIVPGLTEAKRRTAKVFNVTVKTVEARLKLLELRPEVQQAVEEKKIGFWAATELHGLEPEKQVEALTTLAQETTETGKKPSIERAKQAAEKDGAKGRERLKAALEALKDAAIDRGQNWVNVTAKEKRRLDHAVLDASMKFYKEARKA